MSLIDKGWRKWNPKSVSGKKKPSQQDGKGEGDSFPLANFKLGSKPLKRKPIPIVRGSSSIKGMPSSIKAKQLVSILSRDEVDLNRASYRKYLSWSNDSEYEDKARKEREHRRYRINNGQAPKDFDLTMKHLKKRRLSNMLATMVGKIAEDRAGEPIIGNDEWSVPEILNRVMTRVNINSCKQTRERERIVIILDTSPSCSKQASFFIDIAKASANLNDLEMYDAPNAFIVKRYDKSLKKFIDIGVEHASTLMQWGTFRNRTIIFFGDYDGNRILAKSSKYNNIYWFNPDYYRNSRHDRGYTGHHYLCRNEDDLIKLIKKMR